MNCLIVIPAKGRSTGLPGKNKRLMHGKPLYQWTVEQALAADVGSVCVSSDDSDILSGAISLGAIAVHRPDELCEDTTPTEPIVEHAIKALCLKPDIVVLLQVTNPCRTPEHIREAVSFIGSGFDSCLSVVPFNRFVWAVGGPRLKRPLRQDMPPRFLENGSIYSTRYQAGYPNRLWGNIGYLVMPKWSAFEIDTPSDWLLVEFAMKQMGLVKDRVLTC